MSTPSFRRTKAYFKAFNFRLSKWPKGHPLHFAPFHLETTWAGFDEFNFFSLEHLWKWWAKQTCQYMEVTQSVAVIARHYAEADAHQRAEMQFFLFKNFYSARPIPSPPMPWDVESESIHLKFQSRTLPKGWKIWMKKCNLVQKPFLDFRHELGKALDDIDIHHPRPRWAENLALTAQTTSHQNRVRL